MPTFSIPVYWSMYATIVIDADSFDDALEIANGSDLPDDGIYVDDSWDIDKEHARFLNQEIIDEIELCKQNFEVDL